MDWLKFGFGPDYASVDDKNVFKIDFSNVVENFDTEKVLGIAVNTVKSIVQNYPAPYNLMVSGGVDSQAMIYAWHISGVPFNIISFKYTDGNGTYFNLHDLENLVKFTSVHSLKIDFREINIINFLENHLEKFAEEIYCTSPQICTHAYMSQSINDGTLIFSGNALYRGMIMYDYTVFGLERYARKRTNVIPFFFIHDKYIAGSLLGISKDFNILNYEQKCKLYQLGGFPIIPQVQKYTGFEVLKDYYDSQSQRVTHNDRLRYINQPSKRVFDVLFRYRLNKRIKYSNSSSYIYPSRKE